MLGTPLPAMR